MKLSVGLPFNNSIPNSEANFSNNATKISLKSPSEIFQITNSITMSAERIPNDISNISLWLDPSTSSNTIVNGAAVSTYTDKIFGDCAFTNTGSNRPTYSASAINGKPGLIFNSASSQFLSSTGTIRAFQTNVTQGVIFAVVNVTSILADTGTVYLNPAVFSDGPFGYFGIYLKSTPPSVQAYWYTGSIGDSEATFSLSTNILISYYVHDNNIYCQINNGTITSSVGGNRTGFQAPLRIGHSQSGYFNGAIGDIIVLNTYNSVDVNDVQQYLRTKYSLW